MPIAVRSAVSLGTMAELELTARWEGGYRMAVDVRGFELRSDEPGPAGGENTGPMPTELFLASLATCFGSSVVHAARKRGIELPDVAVRVIGTYQGLRFARLRVEVTSSYPAELLQPLIERASSYCYVSNTLRGSPEIEYVIAP